jgi:hypothetical protein
MNTLTTRQTSRWLAMTLGCSVAITALFCATAQAQTWNYKSYKKTMGGQYNKDNFVVGTISVEEKDGKAYFRMNSGVTDACVRGAIPANVTKTETDTTGGVREFKRDDRWITSTWDHDLTLKR